MDWRYWITYSGKVRTDSDDEDVATLAAQERHAQLIYDGTPTTTYAPLVEVEPLEGGEGA